MLTIKQNGKRVINPDITTTHQTDVALKDTLFKTLMVECGFTHDMVDHVWRHTKNEEFRVAFETDNNNRSRFLFLYGADWMNATPVPKDMDSLDFITKFLDESREFFTKARSLQK